jgi:death-on-curing protein
VRDENAIEAALARARQKWHYEPAADLASLAAAYGFGLARAHAFSDGNKRTAFVTMMTFLGLNAKDLSATELEVVEMMVSLAGGELTESALADWIRARLMRFTI